MKIKKLIAIMLALALFMPLVMSAVPQASAAGYTISLRDSSGNSSATVNAGDSITLYVKLSSNPGIISAGVNVDYPDVLSLSAKPSSALSGVDFEPNWTFSPSLSSDPYLIWMNVATGTDDGKLVKYNGSIRKIVFNVSASAESGDYKITLSAPSDKNLTANTDGDGKIISGTNKKISPSVSGFTVTVKGKTCNHSWSSWTETTKPTCDKAGVKTRECSLCHKEEEQSIPALTHNFGAWSQSKAPTCTTAGEEKRTCQRTGCNQTETRTVKALGHSFSNPAVTKEPTCTTAGEKTGKCTRCSETTSEKIPATGHSYGEWTVTKEPTCTTTGTKTSECSKCHDKKTETIKVVAHTYGEWETTKEPNCVTDGKKTAKCTVCGKTKTEKIPASGHKFSDPKITKEPTCTQEGEQSGKCVYCKKNTTEVIPATGHKYAEPTVTLEATCTTPGAKTQKCENCDDTISEEIPALGHEFGESVAIQEATLITPGILQSKCIRCEETQQTETPRRHEDATGLVMEADEAVFQAGTKVTVTQISPETAEYDAVKKAMSDISSLFVAFDISALLDGKEVQPSGNIKASFPVPEGFGKNVALYYISNDGKIEFVPGVLSEDGTSLNVELSHFSHYILCDLDAKPNTSLDMQQIYILVICIASALLVCVIVFIILASARRRKREMF